MILNGGDGSARAEDMATVVMACKFEAVIGDAMRWAVRFWQRGMIWFDFDQGHIGVVLWCFGD